MSITETDVPETGTARRVTFLVLGVLLLLFAAVLTEGIPSFVTAFTATGEEVIHRFHDVQHGVFMGLVATVAFAVQVRWPSPAGAQQVAIVAVTFVIAMLGGQVFAVPVLVFVLVVAAYLAVHPHRDRLLSGQSSSRPLMGLSVIGAVPLLWYAWGQLAIQRTAAASDPHAAPEPHYAGAAAVTLVLVLLAFAAARRPRGWRLPAWSAGLGAVILGIAAVVLPEYRSSFGSVWGAATLLWGLAFLAATERQIRNEPAGRSR